jgi:hypothetical protein
MSIIFDTLNDARVGTSYSYENLTLFPLIKPVDGPPEYLTLDEAVARSAARIKEVSKSGAVPELSFENLSEKPILLVDGEELVGGKQNRILNLSILIPSKRTVIIPVSCTEAGRWAHRGASSISRRSRRFGARSSQEFQEAEQIAVPSLRMAKVRAVTENLKFARGRQARQSEVWSEIDNLAMDLSTHSQSGAMRDSYLQHRSSIEEYVQILPPIKDQVGAVFALNGRMVGLDLFDHPQTLSRLLAKLVRSHAMEALREPVVGTTTTSQQTAQTFIDSVSQATAARYTAIGEGEDLRLETQDIVGGGLEARGRLIHLCALSQVG